MPCDQIITNKIDLKVENYGLLCRALTALGMDMVSMHDDKKNGFISFYDKQSGRTCYVRNGQLELPVGREALADQIKQQYSREVLTVASQKFGWRMEQAKEANTYNFSKRC